MNIPRPVLQTDFLLHQILQEISFSEYLNPTNALLAKQRFLSGKHAPPFTYKPLAQADQFLRRLDPIFCTEDHPAADILNEKITRLRFLILALRDRTQKAFHALNSIENWYPSPELINLKIPQEQTKHEMAKYSAQSLIMHLEEALEERKMYDWKIVKDRIMSARALVDGSKCEIRIKPSALFRKTDLIRLVVHEIDVHAVRSQNGHNQRLKIFSTGLPRSIQTEEGLAMIAERKTNVHTRGSLQQQKWVVWAILKAKDLGFKELYRALCKHCHIDVAWGICQRIKRGLANPELPGVYAKDSVYLSGWSSVTTWLAEGGRVEDLYVGKVSIYDPVQKWIEDGWVHPQFTPAFWTS